MTARGLPLSVVNGSSGTLAARPAANAVSAGWRYFATDTLMEYLSDGTNWTQIGRAGELAYSELTTSLTGQTNTAYSDSGITLPSFVVGSRPVLVELFWPQVLNGTAGANVQAAIAHGNGSLAALNTVVAEANFQSAIAFAPGPLTVKATLTAAGTYVLKARHLVSSGSGKLGLVNAGTGSAILRAEEM